MQKIVANLFLQTKNLLDKYKLLVSCLGVLFLKIVLEASYIVFMNRSIDSWGLFLSIRPLEYTISWLVVLIFTPFIVLLYSKNSPSALIITFFNLIYFIPICSLYGLRGFDGFFFGVIILYWLILIFCQYKMPIIVLKKMDEKICRRIYFVLSFFCIFFVLYMSGKYTDFSIVFDIYNVNPIRFLARTYDIPVVQKYLFSMMPVIIPVLIIYMIYNKKYLLAWLLFLAEYLVFSFDASKSIFFLLFLSIIGYILYERKYIRYFSWCFVGLGASIFLEKLIFSSQYLMNVFFHRVFFVPAILSIRYYEYFYSKVLELGRTGIANKLGLDSMYSHSHAFILGENMYSPKTNVINGLIGDAVFNWGILGCIIMPFFLMIILRFFDACTYALDKKLIIAICLYFSISFINTFWSTVLITHGFLFVCVLLYLFPTNEENKIYE